MTVKYADNFFKALFRWKGSVWKTVWRQLLVWLLLYYSIRLFLYLLPQNKTTKLVVDLFSAYTNRLPLEFLLGFYVTQVVTRWWAQISALPWPDEVLGHACAVLHENDDETRSRRRSIGRYIVLSLILAYRNISPYFATKFSSLDVLKNCGLLTEEERQLIERQCVQPDLQYELPLQWIHEAVRSKVDSTQGPLVFALNAVRNNIRNLTHFNAISFPLVYTQTVTVAVYGYFLFCLIGHQFYMDDVDLVVPFLTVLRFIFGVGWLKVAEHLIRPFGDDDDAVELSIWLKRHIRLAYTTTDYATVKHPTISWLKDDSTLAKVIGVCDEYDSEFEKRNKENCIRRTMHKI